MPVRRQVRSSTAARIKACSQLRALLLTFTTLCCSSGTGAIESILSIGQNFDTSCRKSPCRGDDAWLSLLAFLPGGLGTADCYIFQCVDSS